MSSIQGMEEFTGQITESNENIIKQIEPELTLLLKEHRTGIKLDEMYRNVFQLVLHKKGHELYEMIQEAAVKHLKERTLPSIKNAASSDQQFLKTLLDEWSHYSTASTHINDAMMHLNETHVQEANLEPVDELMKRLFRDLIIQDGIVNEKFKLISSLRKMGSNSSSHLTPEERRKEWERKQRQKAKNNYSSSSYHDTNYYGGGGSSTGWFGSNESHSTGGGHCYGYDDSRGHSGGHDGGHHSSSGGHDSGGHCDSGGGGDSGGGCDSGGGDGGGGGD